MVEQQEDILRIISDQLDALEVSLLDKSNVSETSTFEASTFEAILFVSVAPTYTKENIEEIDLKGGSSDA